MADYLRLRQICLAASALEPVVDDIRTIFELEVCCRDPAVAKYGLVNALFPIGTSFLELVAPTREHTAAGRFLERSAGHGGYMAIFDCAIRSGGAATHPSKSSACAASPRCSAHAKRQSAETGSDLPPRE